MFMTKIYDVLKKLFVLLHFLFSFHYVVVRLVMRCIDEAMKAEMRLQLLKSDYVTVVFLAQSKQ